MSEKIKNITAEKSSFDIVGKKNILLIICAAVILVGLVMFFVSGFNYSTDIASGSMIHVELDREITPEDYNKAIAIIKENAKLSSTVQITGSENTQMFIRFASVESSVMDSIKSSFTSQFSLADKNILASGKISANAGAVQLNTVLLIVCVALFVVAVYAFIRTGIVGGVAFLASEVIAFLLSAAIYALLQIEINTSALYIALFVLVLTSYFTLPLLARAKDDVKSKKLDVAQAVNGTVSASYVKYVLVSVALLIVVNLMLLFGTPSFRAFSLGLVVAVIVSLFVSVCIAGALFVLVKKVSIKRK